MKLPVMSALTLLSATTLPLLAQAEEPSAKPAKAAEDSNSATLRKLINSYNQAYSDHMRKVKAEKDREKRIAIFQAGPKPNEAVASILEIAATDPQGELTEKALVWSLRTRDLEQRKAIGELLLTHYKDSESIDRLAQSWMFDQAQLQDILKRAGNEKVKQSTTYYLASAKIRSGKEKQEGIKLLKEILAWEGLEQSNPKLFNKIKGDLVSLESLSIGSKAPDIVGVDQDDKEFKLSDYRGQAVLVDFWGFW